MLRLLLRYGKFGILILGILIAVYLFPVGEFLNGEDDPTSVEDYDFQIDILEDESAIIEKNAGPNGTSLEVISTYSSEEKTSQNISFTNGSVETIELRSVEELNKISIYNSETELYTESFDISSEDSDIKVQNIDDLTVGVQESFSIDVREYVNVSGNLSETSWDMSDGTSYDGQSIEHNYTSVGEYQVELVVRSDDRVGSETFNVSVEIQDPISELSVPRQVSVGEEVTFDGEASTTGSAQEYEWIIDDKRYTEESPTIVFNESGSYVVKLTALDRSGDLDIRSIKIIVQDN